MQNSDFCTFPESLFWTNSVSNPGDETRISTFHQQNYRKLDGTYSPGSLKLIDFSWVRHNVPMYQTITKFWNLQNGKYNSKPRLFCQGLLTSLNARVICFYSGGRNNRGSHNCSEMIKVLWAVNMTVKPISVYTEDPL